MLTEHILYARFNLDNNPRGHYSFLQVADRYIEGQEVKSAAQVQKN